PGRRVVVLEPEPAVLVDEDRSEGLPRDDRRDQRGRAELRRREDVPGDVERAEEAARPQPPRRAAEPRARRERLEDEEREEEQRDRSDDERDERGANRARDELRELGVDPRLERHHNAGGDR